MDEMAVKPPLVVAENVVGLISVSNGSQYCKLHNALVVRGYRVGAVVVDAANWVPQSRKRVFVIAVDNRIPATEFESDRHAWWHTPNIIKVANGLKSWVWWDVPRPPAREVKLNDVIDYNANLDNDDKLNYLLSLIPGNHKKRLMDAPVDGMCVFPGYRRIRNGRQVLELRFDGLAGCLRTPEGGSSRQIFVIKEDGVIKTRLLTIKEASALMGVGRGYRIPGSYNEAYKAMGDAVAVPVVRYLAEMLLYPIAELSN